MTDADKPPGDLVLESRALEPGIRVVTVVGDVDFCNAFLLRNRLIEEATGGCAHLVLELDRLEYLDATGLGVLIGTLKILRQRGGSLHLVGVTRRIENILRITGMNAVLPTAPSATAAIEHIHAPHLAQPPVNREMIEEKMADLLDRLDDAVRDEPHAPAEAAGVNISPPGSAGRAGARLALPASLSGQDALQAVTRLCEKAGLQCTDAYLTQEPILNAVVLIPSLGLAARCSDSSQRARMIQELRAAAWLGRLQIPVGAPAAEPPHPQAEEADGLIITWWRYLPEVKKAEAGEVCAVVREIHRLEPPPGLLRLFDPMAGIERRIAAATGMREADRAAMRELARGLASRYRASHWPHDRPVVLHGDVHGTNIVATGEGVRVLDLEEMAIGPWEWDLARYYAGFEIGWHDQDELSEAIEAYGRDPRDAVQIDLLAQIWLMRIATLTAAVTGRRPEIAGQAWARIASVDEPGLRRSGCWGDWTQQKPTPPAPTRHNEPG